MDLYTLTDTFLANHVIDEYVSAIWTERYSTAGDVQISLPATAENIDVLKPGTYLAERSTKEVMEIETQKIEEGILTVKGYTLDLAVLNQRYLWAHNPEWQTGDPPEQKVAEYVDKTKKPGEYISSLVTKWAIAPADFPTTRAWGTANLDWVREAIPFLTLGDVDLSGDVQRIAAPLGGLYDAVAKTAEQFKVGISLYLEDADPITGYSLKFKTYQGVDRTSDQAVNDLVRLSPDLDGISNIKEVHSRALYKNVVYVFYKGQIYERLAEPLLPEPEGLDRRVMIIDAEGEPKATGKANLYRWNYYPTTFVTAGDISAFIDQNAKDAFANANYIHAIDGEASPNLSEYKFGIHYGLGDIIELEGLTGAISKARVTEYIRAEDRNGVRAYPTISVES